MAGVELVECCGLCLGGWGVAGEDAVALGELFAFVFLGFFFGGEVFGSAFLVFVSPDGLPFLPGFAVDAFGGASDLF